MCRSKPVTADIAESIGLKKAEGVIVDQPQADSPAAKAGIVAGDVITAIDGAAIKDARDLARKIGMMVPGSRVKLTVARNSEVKTLDLTLGKMPNEQQAKANTGKIRRRTVCRVSVSPSRLPKKSQAPALRVSR